MLVLRCTDSRHPVSDAAKQPQIITEPPLCYTVGTVFFSWCGSVVDVRHTSWEQTRLTQTQMADGFKSSGEAFPWQVERSCRNAIFGIWFSIKALHLDCIGSPTLPYLDVRWIILYSIWIFMCAQPSNSECVLQNFLLNNLFKSELSHSTQLYAGVLLWFGVRQNPTWP